MKNNTDMKNDTLTEKVIFLIILLVGFPLLVTLIVSILEAITFTMILITGLVIGSLAFIVGFILIVTSTD